MGKVRKRRQPLIISGKQAKKAIRIGLDKYLQSIGYVSGFHCKDIGIDFTDEEFDAMIQTLKEDK